MRVLPPLALIALCLLGCSPRVPDVPHSARSQPPRAAPTKAWFGQGRMELVVPGRRISCTALVRGLGDGRARLALMSDEGLQLVDLTTTSDGYEVTQAIEEVKQALPHLGRLARHAFALPPETRAWEGGLLVAKSGEDTRWYGGDPLLLRAVEGPGLDLVLEDYRPLGGEMLAHEARAEGPLGITLRIRLDPEQVRLLPDPERTARR